MKNVYFDANVFFDVFELRVPELYPKVQQLAEEGKVQIVVSDLTLTEALEGNHRDQFPAGITRLLTLSPKWIYVTGLTAREVQAEFGKAFPQPLKPGAHLEWNDFLPFISEAADLQEIRGLTTPTAEALLQFYPPGTVSDRMKYWKGELKKIQHGLKQLMAVGKTKDDIFIGTVAYVLNTDPQDSTTNAFANQLLANPDRASALRIATELNCLVLNVNNPKWTKNDFFDHLHAGALSYVDLFVTRDEGLIQKIAWYDENVRQPRGAAPYSAKVCHTFADFAARL